MKEQLRNILKQEDTVIFIGSGVSIWSGLPSWPGLIQELIQLLRHNDQDASLVIQELNNKEYLQAASYGFDKLSKQQFAHFIRNACRLGIATPQAIHEKIVTLGPRCFITTNYDSLLELSFQKWLPQIHFRTVLNRQLTETAEIVGARASNFLFKLHGDCSDSSSIILTREQYRSLNPGGELHHALETAKTLMVSRPVVYIGFGLRDPDFLYIKDLLLNTYKGGTRDHYAIMADIKDQEKDYWRRNFGIHLISYQTKEKDSKKDFTGILTLLDELSSNKLTTYKTPFVIDAQFLLSLTRYASTYSEFEEVKTYIPLIVHPLAAQRSEMLSFNKYYGVLVNDLLIAGPENLILVGLPGSGKTHALKKSVAHFAKELQKECIHDRLLPEQSIIPIFVDLKLYKGSIKELIEQGLPVNIQLETLIENIRVKIFLDAFNEIPREYIESNCWDSDIAMFLEKFKKVSIVLSSRTKDGLEKLNFPIFNLDSIDEKFIEKKLTGRNLELQGVFQNEVLQILQRPFFYKLVFESNFPFEANTTPHLIYANLLSLLMSRFKERFKTNFDLRSSLAMTAINAIDRGQEAFNLKELKDNIQLNIDQKGLKIKNISESINWLVSQEFIFPIANNRACFFHQSVTEYLAALRFAEEFKKNPNILKEKLRYRRWDQALFLTLSFLEKKYSKDFIDTIIDVDFVLGLSSLKYIEGNSKTLVKRFLSEMIMRSKNSFDEMYNYAHVLEHGNIPIDSSHVPELNKLIKLGNAIGGTAAGVKLSILNDKFKQEAFELLVLNCEDYNFCSDLSRALRQYISSDDISYLYELAIVIQRKLSSKEIKEYEGFESAISTLIEQFDPNLISKAFYHSNLSKKEQKVPLAILCDFLSNCESNEALKISANLLEDGIEKVTYAICIITEYSNKKSLLDYSVFSKTHIKRLIDIIDKANDDSTWAVITLKNILSRNSAYNYEIESYAFNKSGMRKAALLYCISQEDNYSKVYDTLGTLRKIHKSALLKEPFALIEHMDKLSWSGQEDLALELFKLRNVELAYHLSDVFYSPLTPKTTIKIKIDPIEWWLEWFFEVFQAKNQIWMFEERVASFIANCMSSNQKKLLIEEFNKPDSRYRQVLSSSLLRHFEDMVLTDLSSESVQYLLENLKKSSNSRHQNSVLKNIATEIFVVEHLLPLIPKAKNNYLKNLTELIETIGKKHGRRYIII